MATTEKTEKVVKKSKKTRAIIQKGQAHIKASFNNTIVSITDEKGNVLKTLHSMESVDVYVKWIGIGREQAIRGLISGWIDINAIFDITPIPHNGTKKKKVRKL